MHNPEARQGRLHHPKIVPPQGLFPVLGKYLEKLLVRRLRWHLQPTLSTRQYGFMPQRGTEDALYDLVTHIRTRMTAKEVVVLVSLDIEGDFDNAWWPALKSQLVSKGCPRNLHGMVTSYLTDRKVELAYTSSKLPEVVSRVPLLDQPSET